MKKLWLLGLLLTMGSVYAQNAMIGVWKTIDDETHEPKSYVEIYEATDGKLAGKITKLFRKPNEDPDPNCDKCATDDPRYNQRVIGMEIIQDMKIESSGNAAKGGSILDPANGKVYDCKIWTEAEGKELKVRGYILFLYRTQTWKRVE